MKLLIVLLMLVTVGSGLISLAGFINGPGSRTGELSMPLCGVALIAGLLFFLLAVRQSRVDRERREDERWNQLNRR